MLYTDGLTEARRRTDRTATGFELYGEERVASILGRTNGSASADVLENVRDDVREFSTTSGVAGGLAATDPKLVPYGAMTATFYTGVGCLLAPSLLFLGVRALF
jgi:hypothetical protein